MRQPLNSLRILALILSSSFSFPCIQADVVETPIAAQGACTPEYSFAFRCHLSYARNDQRIGLASVGRTGTRSELVLVRLRGVRRILLSRPCDCQPRYVHPRRESWWYGVLPDGLKKT